MHVTLIAAQSIDGFIARPGEPGSGFTSAADQHHFREALRQHDCRVLGAETYRVTRDKTRRSATAGKIHLVVTRSPQAFSADLIPGTLEFTDSAPREILAALEARGLGRCALLGGSQIHSLFLAAGCVDELWLTVEPLLFGGGTPLLAGRLALDLELLSHDLLSAGTLLLKYRINRRCDDFRARP